jgi:hypothetical protein
VPLAAFKDLCLDAADPGVVGRFWADALGLPLEVLDDGDTVVRGGAGQQRPPGCRSPGHARRRAPRPGRRGVWQAAYGSRVELLPIPDSEHPPVTANFAVHLPGGDIRVFTTREHGGLVQNAQAGASCDPPGVVS